MFKIFITPGGGVKYQLFLEGELLEKTIMNLHVGTSHGGSRVVTELLRNKFFYPGLGRIVKDLIVKCVTCLRYNVPKTMKAKETSLLPPCPGRVLQMDLMGPLPPSGGFKYIWGGIASFSRRVILRPMKSTMAKEMFEILTDVFSSEGLWENDSVDAKCVSLRGVDKKFLDTMRVGVVRSFYSSRQQGTIERAFGSLLVKILKLLDNEPTLKGWARVLPRLAFAFNSSPCRSLGFFSPMR